MKTKKVWERTASRLANGSPTCEYICLKHLKEAELIQSSLLPTGPLRDPTVDLDFRFTPYFEVGGDFTDYFRLPDGSVGIYLGDVVGKGLPATLYSALVMGSLRGTHKTGTESAQVLELLNRRLVQRPLPARFCCTLYAVFDPPARTLTFSNAGLPFPLLVSEKGCSPLGEGGLPSGMFPEAQYTTHVVQLSPGDGVLFATDGLHEARNPEGVEFSDERLREAWSQCWKRTAAGALDLVLTRLESFLGGSCPHDDVTAVVLKVPHPEP
jgi:phosphoserine phosphatase RsbU/P